MVKFGYIIHYLTDIKKSIEFYEKSFYFDRKFVTPENEYGKSETGQTTLSLFFKKQKVLSN
jgi:lactoylglutathione lyase